MLMLTKAIIILLCASTINEVYHKQVVRALLLFQVRELTGFSRNQNIEVTKEDLQLKGCILPQTFKNTKQTPLWLEIKVNMASSWKKSSKEITCLKISQLEFENSWENLLKTCLSSSSPSEKQEIVTVAKVTEIVICVCPGLFWKSEPCAHGPLQLISSAIYGTFFLLLTFLQNQSEWNYRYRTVSPRIKCESLSVISLILTASSPRNQQMIAFFSLFFKVFSIWNWQVEQSCSQRYIFLENVQCNWTMPILQKRDSKTL